MINLGERVKRSIDDMQQERYLFALEQMCIAIDMTAKNHYKKNWSTKTIFKNLIREYSWLLELMAFRIDFSNSTFGNFPFKDQNKEYIQPTLQDLIYHVIRCGLIHGNKYNLRFHSQDTIIIGKDLLILPSRLVYGLLAIVVFCSSNKNEITADGYYLTIYEHNFTINAWWGMEELIRLRFQDHITDNPRIIIPYDHFNEQHKGNEKR